MFNITSPVQCVLTHTHTRTKNRQRIKRGKRETSLLVYSLHTWSRTNKTHSMPCPIARVLSSHWWIKHITWHTLTVQSDQSGGWTNPLIKRKKKKNTKILFLLWGIAQSKQRSFSLLFPGRDLLGKTDGSPSIRNNVSAFVLLSCSCSLSVCVI